MQKKRIILLCTTVVILIGVVLFWSPWEKAPLADLRAEEIVSIEVYAIPPNESKLVDDRTLIEEITISLKDVVTYQRSSGASNMGGQLVRYTVHFESGAMIEIGAYNPFVSIDGQYYKTKYEPCERLNSLGNRILETRFGTQ